MLAKLVRGGLFTVLGLMAIVAGLLLTNLAPQVSEVSAAEAANPTMPYVVKLHAIWCPVCMLTKDEWTEIGNQYGGRVNLVVFDSTTESTRAASRAAAERLGLAEILDAYHGATGVVLVIDAATGQVLSSLGGNRPYEDYREAIEAALAAAASRA
jgi:thiol-disulfide isomerase/thioredoxin